MVLLDLWINAHSFFENALPSEDVVQSEDPTYVSDV
jgi:hypothetical protein